MTDPLDLDLQRIQPADTLLSNLGGDRHAVRPVQRFCTLGAGRIPLAGVAVAVAAVLIPGRGGARTNVVEVLHAE